MKIARLLLLLWIPTVGWAQQSFYGTTASSIQLSEGADSKDLERIPLRTGDVITPENVRAAIQALFDTARYRSIEVDAAASGEGTRLTFIVTPHSYFGTFRLLPENLLERPLSTLLRLPVGQKFSNARVEEIVQSTSQLLEDEGYFNAKLTLQTSLDGANRLQSIDIVANGITPKDKAHISEVDIRGGENNFTESELQDAFHISPGETYNSTAIDKGVSAIQKKFLEKNFLNTRVAATHGFNAQENSVRLGVTIEPGQETVIDTEGQISDEEIRKLVPIFEEGAFDPDLIREGRDRIVEYLQREGYFDATVDGPDIVPSTADSPFRVRFLIRKGERHRVKSVQFRGNTAFTSEEIQGRIRVHPAAVLNRGLFSDELVRADVEIIQKMYRAAGYEAAFVEFHREEDSARHEIHVVFEITENSRYPIERIKFEGNMAMSEEELRTAAHLKETDLYAPDKAEEARRDLTRFYYKMGYPDARIEATADRNPETNGKLLTYRISEGRRYLVGKILISGNTLTNPNYIRRTSGLKEYNSPFNPEDVLEGQRKLYATGLFRHVDVVGLDRDEGELRTVLIQVEEAKPIVFTPGIGVKEYAGPRITLDVSHNNILGGARSLGARFRLGLYEQQFQTSYHEPRLFNHESLDGYATLTIENRNQVAYKSNDIEFSLQIRKRLSATKNVLLTASYQTVNLKDIRVNYGRRFPDIEGIIQIARVGASYVTDSRDDPLDPKRGIFTTSTFQIASKGLGSEVDFLSLFNQSTYQRKYGVGVLALSNRIGWKVPYGDTVDLPITERYFAGGSTTLRGFDVDEAGPPGGGQLLTIENVEYRVPIKTFSFGTLGGAAFYDTGNVFERPSDFSFTDYTHSAGLGLRFRTPLGPVRFDVGFNLNPQIRTNEFGLPERQKRTQLFFTLGQAF
jgi:outer membrane protein assembly complex protein YaeT